MTETIVIAGGGTGGHVFPGLAVAAALREAAPSVDVVFVGSPRGIETRVVPPRGYRLELLDVEPMKGGGVRRAFRGALVAARATWRARALIAALRPCAVLSVGGYAAGPVALAGALSGVPIAILEPNGVVGLANRLLAPFAKRAYVAWPSAASRLPARIVRSVGVPLRDGFAPSPYRRNPGGAHVLVMGGSQGARALNEVVPEALALAEVPNLTVLHQSGPALEGAVTERYAAHGLHAEVRPFLDDVAAELRRADLVIARSGAGTVAEVAAVGRAALFIPFPFAADDHQRSNAEALVRAGGALCIAQQDATAARLAAEIASLVADGARLEAMATSSRATGRPRAAKDVATDLLSIASISPGRRENGSGVATMEAR